MITLIKKLNKIIAALILLSVLSVIPANSANASFFDWLVSKEDSNLLVASYPSFEEIFRTALEKNTVKEEPKTERIVVRESFRQVTAYNVGDPYQNDSTPCIGAYTKVNLCEEIAKGVRVCAANFVPKQTMLRVFTKNGQSFDCIVWDRMHTRFSSRVDIAMNYSEKAQARQFGLQVLKVQVLAEADK